ncbi:MAG: hypothetical protein D3906_05800 [Candidatus Electrothrix sp. AUS1_2]|nr:hypothetical protein [Candidatus Electrothrix sp. AUS1_2]
MDFHDIYIKYSDLLFYKKRNKKELRQVLLRIIIQLEIYVMIKGLMLGLLAQVFFSFGLVFVNQSTFDKIQNLIKSNIIIVTIVPFLFIISYCVFFSFLRSYDFYNSINSVYLLIASLFLLIAGEYFFIRGASFSSITTVSLTALAFPIVITFVEYMKSMIFGQEPPVIEIRQVVGFLFIGAGFVIYTWQNS